MKVVIIGAGGHGRVVLDIIDASHTYEVVGFLDNCKSMKGQSIDNIPILGDFEYITKLSENGVKFAIIAIGSTHNRAEIARLVVKYNLKLINAIHPTAIIAPNVQLGKNVVIAPGAIINTGSYIGDNVIINTGAIIDHECKIHDNVHISPGVKLAGRVVVENGAHIGIGSTVIQGLTIGQGSVIGAGSVVLEDITPNCMAAGVPARVKKLYDKEMEK